MFVYQTGLCNLADCATTLTAYKANKRVERRAVGSCRSFGTKMSRLLDTAISFLFTCALAIGFSYQMYEISKLYFSYDVTTSLKLDVPFQLHPTVS